MPYKKVENQLKQIPYEYLAEISDYMNFLMHKKHKKCSSNRALGLLKGTASVTFADDFEMTTQELIN